LTISSFTADKKDSLATVTDHMANERTYLAWVRTGITVMALGFVVAKFGIIIKELVPDAPSTSYHLSSAIGIVLVVAGGFLQIMALRSFLRNKRSIESGDFRPSAAGVIAAGIIILLIAVLLIAYMIVTL
jgi:Predicted membrane protein